MHQNNVQSIEAELRKHFRDDEYVGMLHGILTGTATAEFVGIGKVEFVLTDAERAEYLWAILKSQGDWLGRSIANFMSAELESLVCGHRPERYRVLTSA